MTVKERTKPQVATMNAVHDLPVLVARDKGFFKEEGLDLEFRHHAGHGAGHDLALRQVRFRLRPPARLGLQRRRIDQYRMCEWGIMKRASKPTPRACGGRKIVALGASMSKFAIVVAGNSKYYEPEMLKNQPIAVTPNNGSDFTR